VTPGTPEAPFSECAAATDDLPLRQGDVVEFIAPTSTRFGIVVTADCDIAQLKHNNTISYVPLLALPSFLATFFVPRRLDRALPQLRQDLTRRLTAARQQAQPNSSPFSEEAIDVWVNNADAVAITEAVETPKERREDLIALINTYRRAREARGSDDIDVGVDALTAIGVYRGTTNEKALAKIQEEIQGYLRSLPGDAFFIGSIGETPELRSGFIAYLRILRELHPSNVALRPADLRSAEVHVKRVARLKSPYVYRLTQQLASVFASIGLPTEYETERDRLAKTVKAPKDS